MANEKTNETSAEEKIYTVEEMKEMRNKMTAFYQEELPYLRLQEEYEKLQADIEDHKVRRLVAINRQAHIFAAAEAAEQEASKNPDGQKPNPTQGDQDSSKPTTQGTRTLKKE